MISIDKADLPLIYDLLEKVLGLSNSAETIEHITRLGGLTNRSYHVSLESGDDYVVRIPGEGTEELIRRDDEKVSTELAYREGVDTELLYFGDDGSKLSTFIPGAVTMSDATLRQPEIIGQVASLLHKIHHCGVNTGVAFDVFDMAAQYEAIIKELKVPLFDDYEVTKQNVMKVKAWVDEVIRPALQPCHNDPLCENWVMGTDRLYLIDWEYAGMNDGMWDLAAVSIEASYDEQADQALLTAYYGTFGSQEVLHFLAAKIFVDFLWSLWAVARIPYGGQEMEDWATTRYHRLQDFLRVFASRQSR